MDTPPPLILLQEDGYRFFTHDRDEDAPGFMAQLQAKFARIGEGNLDVTVGFTNRNDEFGELARTFNHMIRQLCESRAEVERLHRTQTSRAECFSAAGVLAIELAHEIRNLLQGVAGLIAIAHRDLPPESPAHPAVGLLGTEITQINRILADLLRASRPHLPEISLCNLNTTVERAAVIVRQQLVSKLITVELHNDPNMPFVDHDSGQIYQVVLNLLLNAVQAIDGLGNIRVGTSILKGNAVIAVEDTGCGIAPENLGNIFQPFYTNKANGTGLGLSLARRTAEEHHGRVEVTSEVGKGTTFVVILPLQQPIALCAAS